MECTSHIGRKPCVMTAALCVPRVGNNIRPRYASIQFEILPVRQSSPSSDRSWYMSHMRPSAPGNHSGSRLRENKIEAQLRMAAHCPWLYSLYGLYSISHVA